jgi:tRNA(fMet)-specific endonuclease VapC
MMAYLIDTDVIIYSLKGNPAVQDWMLANQNIPKFMSVISYGELLYGARKSMHPDKNLATAHRVAELFPVLGLDKGIIEVFSGLKARLEVSGNRLDDMDLMIGATAIYMDLTLVTNNKRHFSRIDDLELESWEPDAV